MPVQTFYQRHRFAPDAHLERDLFAAFTRRQYVADALLTGPGLPGDRLFFVEQGAVQGFYIDHAVEEITFALAAESEVIMTPPNLFGPDAPHTSYLRAIGPVQVLELTHTDLRRLQQQYHAFALLSLQLTEESIRRHEERARMLHSSDPAFRYRWFLERHRNLAGRLKVGMVASYLGVARSTLSRVRSKLAKQKL